MKLVFASLTGLAPILLVAFLAAQELAPNAPPDKPAGVTGPEQVTRFEEAIAPYVKKAQKTLPGAKKKYLKGLPKGDVFFVTTRIYENGKFEQVFVKVTAWEGDMLRGLLASDMSLLKSHKKGEIVTCKETDVLDWTISKPDGTEEGNFVGKFLDSYKP
jgi:uncharacterized protein YegJ (DUF2314 family)